jgi:thiol-disulfide isomerase/thioredoxin
VTHPTRWLVLAMLVACSPRPVAPAPPVAPRFDPALAALEHSRDLQGAIVGRDSQITIVVSFASWCAYCHVQLAAIEQLVRASHPAVRVLGVSYGAFELDDARGRDSAVRRFVADSAPWLRVVPIDDRVYAELGKPPLLPTIWVFARDGSLARSYDPRQRILPKPDELDALLRDLGG